METTKGFFSLPSVQRLTSRAMISDAKADPPPEFAQMKSEQALIRWSFDSHHLGGEGSGFVRGLGGGEQPDPPRIGMKRPQKGHRAEEKGKLLPLPVEDVGPKALPGEPGFQIPGYG
jgi:hypothetical protein